MLGYLDTLIGFAVVMLGVSLIVTIATQIASSLFSHRGTTLLWGLEVLFKQMDPKVMPVITAEAHNLAQIVLTHPLASDSLFAPPASKRPGSGLWNKVVERWRLANAISTSDLVAVLKNIADNPPSDVHRGTSAMIGAEINAMLAKPSPVALRQVAMTQAVASANPNALVQDAIGVTATQPGNLDVLFNKMLDRIAQRFTMWMRVWTVLFSFTIAGVGCIDTFDLIHKLFTNSELRTQLVNAAPQMMQIADRATNTIDTEALKQAADGTGVTPPTEVLSAEAAYTWIDKNIDPGKKQDVRTKFDAAAASVTKSRWQDAQNVGSTLSNAGVLNFDFTGWRTACKQGTLLLTLLGVLTSGLLLSLGAPFWYNTLKSVVSLRPVLAGKQATAAQTANQGA